MCTLWLPNEMWMLLFGYLSLSEILSLRATCKYFRDVVDNSDLWKDCVWELSDKEYEEQFWNMLRRWRVTTISLCSLNSWTHLVNELPGLPGLKTLKINTTKFYEMPDFSSFTNLERLHLAYLGTRADLEEFSLLMPPRLEHLTLCHSTSPEVGAITLPIEISPDSPFKKLKSFSLHCSFFYLDEVKVLHFFLSSLPQLQHLSLSLYNSLPYKGNISDLPPLKNCSLSSLELCNCKNLPKDLMKMVKVLPFLRSLAIFCVNEYSLDLSTWLRDLPALTSLLVMCTDLSEVVSSIPRGLTHLTLIPRYLRSKDIPALAQQVPNLCHLHLGPLTSSGGEYTELIPQYFPKLNTLRILKHSNIYQELSAEDKLRFSQKELEYIEIRDKWSLPASVVSEFEELTNNRVWIHFRSTKDQLWSCNCTFYTSLYVYRAGHYF